MAPILREAPVLVLFRSLSDRRVDGCSNVAFQPQVCHVSAVIAGWQKRMSDR